MESLIKVIAIFLTLSLLVMVYYGISQGLFFSLTFWLVYIAAVVLDLLCIAWLKKEHKH